MLFVVSNNLRFNGLSESEFRILMDLKNYRRRSTGRIFKVPVDRPVDRPRHNGVMKTRRRGKLGAGKTRRRDNSAPRNTEKTRRRKTRRRENSAPNLLFKKKTIMLWRIN